MMDKLRRSVLARCQPWSSNPASEEVTYFKSTEVRRRADRAAGRRPRASDLYCGKLADERGGYTSSLIELAKPNENPESCALHIAELPRIILHHLDIFFTSILNQCLNIIKHFADPYSFR